MQRLRPRQEHQPSIEWRIAPQSLLEAIAAAATTAAPVACHNQHTLPCSWQLFRGCSVLFCRTHSGWDSEDPNAHNAMQQQQQQQRLLIIIFVYCFLNAILYYGLTYMIFIVSRRRAVYSPWCAFFRLRDSLQSYVWVTLSVSMPDLQQNRLLDHGPRDAFPSLSGLLPFNLRLLFHGMESCVAQIHPLPH